MPIEICTRCQTQPPDEMLREILHSSSRSLQDLLRHARHRSSSSISQRAREHCSQRLQQEQEQLAVLERLLKDCEEEISHQVLDFILKGEDVEEITQRILDDEMMRNLEQQISSLKWKSKDISEEDISRVLEDYRREGYVEIEQGNIRITSKGAQRLAATTLKRILQNLNKRDLGTHTIKETGYGADPSAYARRYEVGDDYALVNIEKTLLNALQRGKLELEPEDFEVHEPTHETKLCAGLIIDESGSMRGSHKLIAAIESALALSELIRREPRDALKVFVFSEIVRKVQPWEIVNEVLTGGCTDIRAALRTFREAVKNEKGDKQAYLITDSEPNTEDGRYVGFEQAVAGVVLEALNYRKEGITLNIIMLDETPALKDLASFLARKNLGRVFFTTPLRLGEVIVEDYLRSRELPGSKLLV